MAVVPTKQMDGQLGKVVLHAAHSRYNAVIFWHIDEKYIGQTSQDHRIACSPEQGVHRLALIDDEGNVLNAAIDVR